MAVSSMCSLQRWRMLHSCSCLTSTLTRRGRVENVTEVGEASKRTNTVITFHLQSNAADGQRRIDAFVDAAYRYYQASHSCCMQLLVDGARHSRICSQRLAYSPA